MNKCKDCDFEWESDDSFTIPMEDGVDINVKIDIQECPKCASEGFGEEDQTFLDRVKKWFKGIGG